MWPLAMGEVDWAGQVFAHVVLVIAPIVTEYFPIPQLLQASVLATALYLPATHSVHVPPPAGPDDPALHVHVVTELLPAGESEFVGQLSPLAFPLPDLYFPSTHSVHVPPLGPVHPASQVQAVEAVLPAGESEFSGQLSQSAFPLLVLYDPAMHSVHISP